MLLGVGNKLRMIFAGDNYTQFDARPLFSFAFLLDTSYLGCALYELLGEMCRRLGKPSHELTAHLFQAVAKTSLGPYQETFTHLKTSPRIATELTVISLVSGS